MAGNPKQTMKKQELLFCMRLIFFLKNNQQIAKNYYQHAMEIWKKLDEQKEIKTIQAS